MLLFPELVCCEGENPKSEDLWDKDHVIHLLTTVQITFPLFARYLGAPLPPPLSSPKRMSYTSMQNVVTLFLGPNNHLFENSMSQAVSKTYAKLLPFTLDILTSK